MSVAHGRPIAPEVDPMSESRISRWPWQRWAVVTLCVLAVLFLTWGAWSIVSWLADDPGAVTAYREDGGSLVAARALEIFALVFAVWFLAWIARGCIREGRITLDAIFVLAGATGFWLDPFYNVIRPNLLYSSQFINVGSWCGHVPGIPNPDCGMIPEPLIFVGLFYVVGVPAAAILGCAIFRWCERALPNVRWTVWKLGAVAFAFGVVFDAVWEIPIELGDLWKYSTYPSEMSIPGLDRADRFPAAPMIAGAVIFGGAALTRYFKDDRGDTFLDVGVRHIRSPRKRLGVTTLAAIGLVQVLTILCVLPIMLPWPYHDGPWPEYPKHILNAQCESPTPGSHLAHLCPRGTR